MKNAERAPNVFTATVFRGGNSERNVIKKLHYAYTDTFVPGVLRWLVRNGHAGDLVVVTHDIHGTEMGVAKMTALGRVKTDWLWEREFVLLRPQPEHAVKPAGGGKLNPLQPKALKAAVPRKPRKKEQQQLFH